MLPILTSPQLLLIAAFVVVFQLPYIYTRGSIAAMALLVWEVFG